MTNGHAEGAPTTTVGASSPYRKFDRYTMGTLYVVTPLAPLVSLLLVAESSSHSWATAAHLCAIVLAAILCAFVLRAAVRHHPVERPWPKVLVTAFVVVCLAAAAFGAIAAPPGSVPGIDVPTGLVLISLVTLAFGFSPALSWRRIGWVSLLIAVPTLLVWVWLHPDDLGSGRWFPVVFTSWFGTLTAKVPEDPA